MKSKLFILSLTIFLFGCSLSEDTPDTGELEAYQLTFQRISRQDTTDYDERDYHMISVIDSEVILAPDFNSEIHDNTDDYIESYDIEVLVNISLEDNTIYIEGEESEFTFTPSSRTVYSLGNGTRYQLFISQNGEGIDENPFYTEE